MITRIRALPRRELVVLALAIGVLIAVGVARDHATAPVRFDTSSSYDVASGGYRAAYEMLGRIGVPVERYERHAVFLPASLATLVYVDPTGDDPTAASPSAADIAALEAWVRAGGTLVYIGDDDVAAHRGILGLPHVVTAPRRGATAFVAAGLRARGVGTIASAARLRFDPGHRAKRVLVADARGALVIAYSFGRGRVTAVVDRALFANAGIASGDRARLLAALVTSARPAENASRAGVAFDEFAHGFVVPEHWWLVVPRPFAFAVAFGAIVVLVAFAGAAVRLGPPIVAPARDDRSSADFIDALANLYERKGVAAETLREVADTTTLALARASGLGAHASRDEVAVALAREPQRSRFAELHELAGRARLAPDDFVRGVALAHTLRKDHAAHDRPGN